MSSEDLRNHFPLNISFVAHAWQQKMSLKPILEKVSLPSEIHYHTFKHHCSLLDGPDCQEFKIEYGVNWHSLLDELPYFSDIMHDLFEGVISYELKLLIDHCSITQSYFCINHGITYLIMDIAKLETRQLSLNCDKPHPKCGY